MLFFFFVESGNNETNSVQYQVSWLDDSVIHHSTHSKAHIANSESFRFHSERNTLKFFLKVTPFHTLCNQSYQILNIFLSGGATQAWRNYSHVLSYSCSKQYQHVTWSSTKSYIDSYNVRKYRQGFTSLKFLFLLFLGCFWFSGSRYCYFTIFFRWRTITSSMAEDERKTIPPLLL